MKTSTNFPCRFSTTLLLFFLFASLKMLAQPVYDNNGTSANTNSINSFNVPAGNDRLLVVCTVNGANANIPTVTFGSTTMGVAKEAFNTNGLKLAMHYLVLGSGTSTSGAITATGTLVYRVGASSYHNVKQSSPFDGETSQSIAASATSSTLPVNSTADGLVCDCIGYFAAGFTGFTVNPAQTEVFNGQYSSPVVGMAMSTKAGTSPSVSMNWSLNGSTSGGGGVHIGLNLKSASCPATGTIWYVDASAASGGNGASWDCAFQNVQDAINAASSGHEIWVKTGTYLPTLENGGTGDRFKTFLFNKNVKIYGGFDGTETLLSERDWVANLTTLSGDLGTPGNNTDNAYRVVTTSGLASTATLDGFTISDGNANGSSIFDFGGGAFNNGNTSLVFANCTFSDNSANGNGGGMYIISSSPTLTNCTFTGNTAGNAAGALLSVISSITLTGCTFTDNSAPNGGGLYLSAGSATLSKCVFSGNSAVGGGALFISELSPIFTDCLFSGNSTTSQGGSIYSTNNAAPSLTNCTFSGNNTTNSIGGGIYAIGGSLNLTNCLIWNNRAIGGTGSAFASLSKTGTDPTITYSLIQGWNPSGMGNLDGITPAAQSNYPNFVTPLDPATAPSTSGDFHIQAFSPIANVGDNASAPATDLFGNTRPYGTTVDLGVHELQAENIAPCPAAGTIWYVDASAASGGNGASWGCAFQNVQDAINAASSGHEVWVKAGTYLPIEDPFGNTSPTDPRDKTFYLKNGVALYGGFDGTETMRSERNWTANLTTLSGDIGTASVNTDNCYHVVLSVSDVNTAVLDGFTVSNGNADGSGTITVETESVSRTSGGGMYNYSSSPMLTNCTFSGNSAATGGGIYSVSSSPMLTNCTFSGNSVTSGAGVYNAGGSPTLTNCTFSGNTASNSGGGMVNSSASPMLTNCTFSSNTAGSGGGVYNVFSSPTLTNCTFSGNSTTTYGGGMRNNGDSSPTVTNCIFSGNSTNNFGGGMSNTDTASPTLTNCSFSGNSANLGGGMHNSVSTSPTLTNCTFSGNRAVSASSSGGIYDISSNPIVLTNCVIWNNRAGTATGSAEANLYSSPSTPTITYSLIQNQTPFGTGNLDGITDAAQSNYPNFVTPLDPASAPSILGDFHLQDCSPIANVGDNANAPTTDLDGNSRPFNITVDLGAYERQTNGTPASTWYADTDNDGFGDPTVTQESCTQPSGYVSDNTDCDDSDPAVNPATVWYKDADGDGYSDGTTQVQCAQPMGYDLAANLTATSGDCDDTNSAVNPAATEVCNGIDDDCDTEVDEGAANPATWYADSDNDGYGDPSVTQESCTQPSGYVSNNTDCDDSDPAINPTTVWYKDADGDGYSDGTTLTQCAQPMGYDLATNLTATSGDCDDTDAAVNPSATEVCNGIDDNCNMEVDEGAASPATWYADSDMDGYGDPLVSQTSCTQPSGYVSDNTDCNDTDPAVNPATVWYKDGDGDGYSDGTTQVQCAQPMGYDLAANLTAASGDCDDINAAVNPSATEMCNGIDDDCSGIADDGLTFNDYYFDGDGDGYGAGPATNACEWPGTGYVLQNGDCDDNNIWVSPSMPEVCNGIDDDCSGIADDDLTFNDYYFDGDGDGYGAGSATNACEWPGTGYVLQNGDCDDNNIWVSPSVPEVCNGIDDDCSGVADDGLIFNDYYFDGDGDGFGAGPATNSCEWPGTGYVLQNGDCNDSDPAINPGATETCDGVDNNCNNLVDTNDPTLVDNDPPLVICKNIMVALDGQANASISPNDVFQGGSDNCGSVIPVSVVPNTFTCANEGNNLVTLTVNDGNGNSNSCNATVTVQAFLSDPVVTTTGETCPGMGNGTITISASAPSGQVRYSINGGLSFSPSGLFVNLSPGTYNIVVKVFGIANICEKTATATVGSGGSSTTWYKDMDGDGYTDGVTYIGCTPPANYLLSALPGDCDDNDPFEFPGQVWWRDMDNDNYSNGTSVIACQRPIGYKTVAELASTETDCNDGNAAVHPNATEICDGIDNDCDAEIDEDLLGETYVGNVQFSTQAQVDNWSACYTKVQGFVSIIGMGITDLEPLVNIKEITGNLTIQSTGLVSKVGLDSLTEVGGTLTIFFNSALTSLNGLTKLDTVGGAFYMYYNFQLSDCCAIKELLNGGVAGPIVVFYNKVGCNSVQEINNTCVPAPIVGGNSGNLLGSAASQMVALEKVSVYPNPNKGSFTVTVPGHFEEGNIIMLDITGRPVLQRKLVAGQSIYQFEDRDLSSGFYLVYVKPTGQPTQAIRLMIE